MDRNGVSIGSCDLSTRIGAGEGKETFLEYLLCAQFFDKYFIYIFNTHNNVASSVALSYLTDKETEAYEGYFTCVKSDN